MLNICFLTMVLLILIFGKECRMLLVLIGVGGGIRGKGGGMGRSWGAELGGRKGLELVSGCLSYS